MSGVESRERVLPHAASRTMQRNGSRKERWPARGGNGNENGRQTPQGLPAADARRMFDEFGALSARGDYFSSSA
jgi:hypothetical protein